MTRHWECPQARISTGGLLFSCQVRLQYLLRLHLLFGLFFTTTVTSVYYTSPTGCTNEKRHGPQGMIVSPSYPSQYPNNVCKQWTIYGSRPKDVITISFTDLDIDRGDGGSCNQDNLSLGGDPETGTLCGSILTDHVPKAYISNRNHCWIKFISDSSRVGRGFSLTYIIGEVPSSEPCLKDEFRCHNGKCILDIWKCNGADECGDNSDELQCINGTRRPTVPPYQDCPDDKFMCKAADTGLLSCFYNYRKCDLHVDCQYGTDEMDCDSFSQCGAQLDGPFGTLTSPGYPLPYPSKQDCDWTIIVQPGSPVQLRFISFHLNSNFKANSITIYNGRDEFQDVLGKFYRGHHPPPLIESTSNIVFIKYRTETAIAGIGFNMTYQQKGACFGIQIPCGFGEYDCYTPEQKCDGVWDCKRHGGDERGCGKCPKNKFPCGTGNQCYDESDHCNGLGHCFDNQDELNCTPDICGAHNGTFLCRNRRCIYESWHCDGANDCEDNSDELDCSEPSVRVITAAVVGSLICGLLLVIALGCTCKLYALRLQEAQGGPRFETPMSRLQEEFMRRQAPPPYNEAMRSSRPFEEAQRDFLEQLQAIARRSRHHRSRSSRSSNQQGAAAGQQPPGSLGAASDSNPSPPLEGSTSTASTVPCESTRANTPNTEQDLLVRPPSPIPHMSTSDSESDASDDDNNGGHGNGESSNVNISIASGLQAQWRRQQHHKNHLPSSSGGSRVEEDSNADVASASTDSVIISLSDGEGDIKMIDLAAEGVGVGGRGGPELLRVHRSMRVAAEDGGNSDGDSVASDSIDTSFSFLRFPHGSISSESLDDMMEQGGDTRPLLHSC